MVLEVMQKPIVGRQLFDVITSGMYDNPLMVFREYIQNAVDSVDLAIGRGDLSLGQEIITVDLSGDDRTISIKDNGSGLPNGTAHKILRSLGCSPKEGSGFRGFRGIGRLGGLAYCDELVFETRSSGDEQVAVVSWDRLKLDSLSQNQEQFIGLIDALEKVSTSCFRPPTDDDPQRFFTVTMRNVRKFHSDSLMNFKIVYDYLAQVAPVSYEHNEFSFAKRLDEYLSKANDFKCYYIYLNGKKILRPYCDSFKLSKNVSDSILDVEFFKFIGCGSSPIAIGWFARTNSIAALPKKLNIRGLRIRLGNIEVGDESYLGNSFTEKRFASWHIGEIHILDNSLKPNARRDGFEQTPEFERFLEQASLLGSHLSGLCRKASNLRIAQCRAESLLESMENSFSDCATYLDRDHFNQTLAQSDKCLEQIEKNIDGKGFSSLKERIESLKSLIRDKSPSPLFVEDILDGRKLRKYDQKSLLKQVTRLVIEEYDKSNSAEEIMQRVLSCFSSSNQEMGRLVSKTSSK